MDSTRRLHIVTGLAGIAAVSLVISGPAVAGIVQDFSGPVAGTVVAGEEPTGGTAPGTLFPDFTVSVTNTGGGPQSLIIFDSANPTGEDPDLGSPNETCPGGGPGQGIGGEVGAPGENCTPLGNLLIVAEDIDDANGDNVVDDPDDEAGGGSILFTFDHPVDPTRMVIMDIDSEQASVTTDSDTLLVTVDATDLGNNSAQDVDLTGNGGVTTIRVQFSSSGAVAEIEYDAPVSVDAETWGRIKAHYR